MSLLERLQNNESVLLMYLADELPPEDRFEVEQLLRTDDQMRAELERLAETEAAWQQALQRLDLTEKLPVQPAVAERQAMRLVRKCAAERLPKPVAPKPAEPRKPTAWWVYPSSAAAAALVGFLIWYGNSPPGHWSTPPVAQPQRWSPWMPEDADLGPVALEYPFDGAVHRERVDGLSAAEEAFVALAYAEDEETFWVGDDADAGVRDGGTEQ